MNVKAQLILSRPYPDKAIDRDVAEAMQRLENNLRRFKEELPAGLYEAFENYLDVKETVRAIAEARRGN